MRIHCALVSDLEILVIYEKTPDYEIQCFENFYILRNLVWANFWRSDQFIIYFS